MVPELFFFTTLSFFSAKLVSVPTSSECPPGTVFSTASYYELEEKIVLYGGTTPEVSVIYSNIYYFDIKTSKWSEIVAKSSLAPPGLYSSHSFIFNSKFFLLLGKTKTMIFPDCYSFDLVDQKWNVEELKGHELRTVAESASTLFSFNGRTFFAVHGGIDLTGFSESLYLIDVETLNVVKMSGSGQGPGNIHGHSIQFFNNSLFVFGISKDLPEKSFFRYDLNAENWSVVDINDYHPDGRFYHSSAIYNGKLYIFFGTDKNIKNLESILEFDFASNKWKEITSNLEIFRFGSSIVVKNDSVYFISGSDSDNLQSSIIQFDFKDLTSGPRFITKSLSFPLPRKNHISSVINSDMFIFGGVTNDDLYLNDIWKFSIRELEWIKIEPKGVIPKGRELVSSLNFLSFGFLIYGGRDKETVFSDLFFYSILLNEWIEYFLPVFNENPRYGACFIHANNYVIVIGGQNNFKIFKDVFSYDFSVTKSTSFKHDLPIEVSGFKCENRIFDQIVEVYLVGGNTRNSVSTNKIVKITFSGAFNSSLKLENLKILDFKVTLPSYPSLVLDKSWLHIIGGVIQTNWVSNLIISINLENSLVLKQTFSKDFGLYSLTAVHLLDSIFLFGGVKSSINTRIKTSGTNELYEFSFDKSFLNLSCLNGKKSPKCEFCSPGNYYLDETCVPCEAGSYSTKYGTSSSIQCDYCEFGTFNDKPGATYCKICPDWLFCPIKSKFPKVRKTSSFNESIQPRSWSAESGKTMDLMKKIVISASASFFVLLLCLLFVKSFRYKITKFDIFVAKHENPLGTPVILKKTLIGGIFSIAFLLFAMISTLFALYIFFTGNVEEFKTLIPSIIVEDRVTSKHFRLSLELSDFTSECSQQNFPSSISAVESGFIYSNREVKCLKIQDNCLVVIDYNDFELISDGMLKMLFSSTLAFTNHILINMSTSSSIPGEPSRISQHLSPPNESLVFKGNEPSIVRVEFIPSVNFIQIFKSDSSDWPSKETGYHILNTNKHSIGSVVGIERIYINVNVIIQVEITKSNTALVTTRNKVSTWFAYIAALIGSTFGLLEIFAIFMGVIERFCGKVFVTTQNKVHGEKFKRFRDDLATAVEENKILSGNETQTAVENGFD